MKDVGHQLSLETSSTHEPYKRKPLTSEQKLQKNAEAKLKYAETGPRVLTEEQKTAKAAREKLNYEANSEKIIARNKAFGQAHISRRKNYILKSRYGITENQREEMFISQGSVCAICETDVPSKRGWHTDHCHTTGVVRGILCSHCNVMLGYARDNPRTLIKAAEYLGK